MNDWKEQLQKLYNSYSTQQKNKKGVDNKFDKEQNFRGKNGFNDTGIALTPKAIQKQKRGRSSYRYPLHLQRINEKRRSDAMLKWNVKEIPAAPSPQPAATTNHTRFIRPEEYIPTPKPKKKSYNYYWGYSEPEPEEVTYVWDEPKKKKTTYMMDGRFPKLDEALRKFKK